AQGAPVLAVSLDGGIAIFTYRRPARKIYEIYDQLAMAAIGQQSDVEMLRVAALEFAHQEGYNRSEQDVTIQRVVNALTASIKRSFADFSYSPVVARALFAELGQRPEDDNFTILDFDGDYSTFKGSAVVAGDGDLSERLQGLLSGEPWLGMSPENATTRLQEIWRSVREEGDPAEGLEPEAALLERNALRASRFRVLL
ncbi:MAG TPA: hypothetical protein VEX38_08530, partial [Fimbriimonadaceae bacterium]|nr:hypothetical protein [Fimbriimonadaceae bacterium]